MNAELIYKNSLLAIPGGVNSPIRSFSLLKRNPLVAVRGAGSILFDADGKSYIDYCCSWGALLFGHAKESVSVMAADQVHQGASFGLLTPWEGEMGRRICSHIPSIERIRFVTSGTEAAMTALRLARAFTKRSRFIKFSGNYHGHADPFLVKAGSGVSSMNQEATSLGIPQAVLADTVVLPFNDESAFLQAMDLLGDQIAAVFVEPIAANMGLIPATPSFIRALREETKRRGALLVFDEVISGYRVAKGGAQSLYGVIPDLTLLGKVIGGGFPVAAVGGRRDVMEQLAPLGQVYQAGTLSGNPVAMRAGLAVMDLIEKNPPYERLEEKGRSLMEPVIEAIQETKAPISFHRVGSLLTLFFGLAKAPSNAEEAAKVDVPLFTRFFDAMLQQGILIPPHTQEAWFTSDAHTEEEIDRTARAIASWIRQTDF